MFSFLRDEFVWVHKRPALSQTLPDRLMLQTMPLSAINRWNGVLAAAVGVMHQSIWLPGAPDRSSAFMTLPWVQGVIELVGGALLAIGLFTRPVAFVLSGNMAVAHFMPHAPKGFFPLLNGGDGAILYCFIFFLFFVAGPGRWSLDAKVGESSVKSTILVVGWGGRLLPATLWPPEFRSSIRAAT